MCVQNHSYSFLVLLEGIANCFRTAMFSGKYCPVPSYLLILTGRHQLSLRCDAGPAKLLTLDKMDRWKSSQVILALFFTSAHGKGLFSGVPCSRSYRCVTESSNVMAEISNVKETRLPRPVIIGGEYQLLDEKPETHYRNYVRDPSEIMKEL